jgi:hypothetical protein
VLLEGWNAAGADEMVMWPPAPVMDLARHAVDSGGDPGAIHRALDPTVLPVSVPSTPFARSFFFLLSCMLNYALLKSCEDAK